MASPLVTRALKVRQELADLDESKAGGLPNIVGAGGAVVDHNKYKMGLYDELEFLYKRLGVENDDQFEALVAGEQFRGFEIETELGA